MKGKGWVSIFHQIVVNTYMYVIVTMLLTDKTSEKWQAESIASWMNIKGA